MDARASNGETETRFLPAVAQAIAEWFYPDLENPGGPPRCVAVSDIDISMESIPTLPLVLVAFTQSAGEQLRNSSSQDFRVTDTFVVDFWMKPMRIKSQGKDTPYWSYYPYELIRNKLITGFLDFTGPNGEHVAYRGLRVGTTPLAAQLTFTFIATFQWCASDLQVEADRIDEIGFRLCDPPPCIPDPVCPEGEYQCENPCP